MFDAIRTGLGILRPPTVEECERRYLSEAANRYDLECRERQVAGGLFRQPQTFAGLHLPA